MPRRARVQIATTRSVVVIGEFSSTPYGYDEQVFRSATPGTPE
jgi:hypothetical protein